LPKKNQLRFIILKILPGAAVITAFQIALAISLSDRSSFSEAYNGLCQWDCSAWYGNITETGYHSSIPLIAQHAELANVAFFPAFPYTARIAHIVFHLSPPTALVLVSQLACFLFWSTLLYILYRWKTPLLPTTLAVVSILAHPAAFFLVTGYSESLFLGSLLAYFYLDERFGISRWFTAAMGILMTATRIVGLPLALFPLMRFIKKEDQKEFYWALCLSGISSGGGLGFFLYCYLRFGTFDLYMQTQKIGWGIVPNYFALFQWDMGGFASTIDQWSIYLTLMTGMAFLLLEMYLGYFQKLKTWTDRLPIYISITLLFYVTFSGLQSLMFRSMIRYTLPWHILFVLCAVSIWSQIKLSRSKKRNLGFAISASITLLAWTSFYYLQIPHLRDYLHSIWFA
jgi:hypothetical protein